LSDISSLPILPETAAVFSSSALSAQALLRRIIRDQPDLIEAQARLGGILFYGHDDTEFVAWHNRLTRSADQHPEIWHLRGLWARRQQQTAAAVRCFLEAAQRDPNHSGAIFQLSQLLRDSEYAFLADSFAARSKSLSQLNYLLAELRGMNDFRLIRKVVDLMDQLGRPLEAVAWCRVVQQLNPQEQWAVSEELRLAKRLVRSGELLDQFTIPEAQLARRVDLDEFPLPDWQKTAAEVIEDAPTHSAIQQTVRFENEAASAGIDFRYYNGTTETTGLVHILQAILPPMLVSPQQ
jgi:tetratricopeptide (TPR) repeat protein